jgi:hypothetical protein
VQFATDSAALLILSLKKASRYGRRGFVLVFRTIPRCIRALENRLQKVIDQTFGPGACSRSPKY